jgi:hypothetical protein
VCGGCNSTVHGFRLRINIFYISSRFRPNGLQFFDVLWLWRKLEAIANKSLSPAPSQLACYDCLTRASPLLSRHSASPSIRKESARQLACGRRDGGRPIAPALSFLMIDLHTRHAANVVHSKVPVDVRGSYHARNLWSPDVSGGRGTRRGFKGAFSK